MLKQAVACIAATLAVTALPATASASEAAPTVICYDSSQVRDWDEALGQNSWYWSGHGKTVTLGDTRLWPNEGCRPVIRFVPSDSMPDNTVIGPVRPNDRPITVRLSRAALRKGFSAERLVAREYGRIFGLPMNNSGKCDDIMSGVSAGKDCHNFWWPEAQVAQMNDNYR
ncbi:snapalysin family zinc-dependent metalloprotease [Lentzea sp. JNUCC 0626]|uniref:snapalysin family zinc-dependent metalloprotease n=1 Tax=Lentzea sp. JNUCC 0626 TaxID=3367513 RepID=UPI003747F957